MERLIAMDDMPEVKGSKAEKNGYGHTEPTMEGLQKSGRRCEKG